MGKEVKVEASLIPTQQERFTPIQNYFPCLMLTLDLSRCNSMKS